MMRYLKLLCFTLVLSAPGLQSQTLVDDYFQKIEKKLIFDKKYLNVYAVTLQPSAAEAQNLRNIPRAGGITKVSFESRENIVYHCMFMKEGIEIDSVVLLAVRKIEDKAAAGESFFGSTAGAQIDTTLFLTFTDLQELYFTGSPQYYTLLQAVIEAQTKDEPAYLLGVRLTERTSKSKGITSPDNTDFLNDARTNSLHRYPVVTEDAKRATSGRRRGQTQTAETPAAQNEYQIDANFARVSFFHKVMDLGYSSLSAELGSETKSLNLMPWQGMSLSLGIRSYFYVSNFTTPNPKNDFLIDAKILGRMRLNTYNLAGNLPFVFADKPKLHVGSGIIFDVTGTRTFGLPFFNIYLAVGSDNVENPYIKFGTADTSHAYFTFKQWEATMSFYWNASEEKSVRYRFDVGAGNYDVYRADYMGTSVSQGLLYNKIKPILKAGVNFCPQNVDFLGFSLKWYDNILGMNLWLRLFELPGGHSFRLETAYNSAPLFRSPYAWENVSGSSAVQIRYRLGF